MTEEAIKWFNEVIEVADMESVRGRRQRVEQRFDNLEVLTRGGIVLQYMSRPGDGAVRYHVSTPTGWVVLKGLKAVEHWLDGVDVGVDAMTEARGWGE